MSETLMDKKEEFLKATFSYMVEHGLENTSVRELCRETKIASGSMYYWFNGKDDIYVSAVLYGTANVANKLFDFAFRTMSDFQSFCSTFLTEIDQYKKEFRLVFQVTSSPKYGQRLRDKASDFKAVYEKNIVYLADILSLPPAKVAPIIYLLISILVDYVIWEDRESSQMQLNFLSSSLCQYVKTIQDKGNDE